MYAKYDEEKIRQIVSNLLSNALKFTSKKGDIYLSISLDNNNHLCIKVKDTGKGIPESQQHHHILTDFTRLTVRIRDMLKEQASVLH
jgi:signal transduction histidine kinase